jgi:hypothetical protein
MDVLAFLAPRVQEPIPRHPVAVAPERLSPSGFPAFLTPAVAAENLRKLEAWRGKRFVEGNACVVEARRALNIVGFAPTGGATEPGQTLLEKARELHVPSEKRGRKWTDCVRAANKALNIVSFVPIGGTTEGGNWGWGWCWGWSWGWG